MIHRWLTTVLVLLGLALLAASPVLYLLREDGPGVTIDPPARECMASIVGATTSAIFHIHNPTRHTVRVVGLAEC